MTSVNPAQIYVSRQRQHWIPLGLRMFATLLKTCFMVMKSCLKSPKPNWEEGLYSIKRKCHTWSVVVIHLIFIHTPKLHISESRGISHARELDNYHPPYAMVLFVTFHYINTLPCICHCWHRRICLLQHIDHLNMCYY